MPMPWVRALLHDQVVYARAKADGTLQVQGNRVEVCYSPNASRLYNARATNVVKEEARYADPATINSTPSVRGMKRDRQTRIPNGKSHKPQKIAAT